MPIRFPSSMRSTLVFQRLAGIALPVVLAAGLFTVGCADIEKAKAEDATTLAELRANLEQDRALDHFVQVRKKEIAEKGGDPDQLDNYQNPEAGKDRLRADPRFAKMWRDWRARAFTDKRQKFGDLAAEIVKKCVIVARAPTASAELVDKCVMQPPAARLDPMRATLIGALVLVLGVGGMALYRSARRRIDPVALAGQKLGLTAQQASTQTTLSGEYKGFAIRIEASAPEVGQGDGYLRALILSKVDPHTIVRFGPLAPPTGLDLPDLTAPEVHDSRIPEGYKMRLSPGADGEPMLSGDIGFQLRAFDPADIRVHDGMAGLTCWQVPGTPEKVIEFVDLAVTVARQYAQT